MKEFWLCFVPLFVAVDAIGVLPLFMNLTENIPPQRMTPVIRQSVITATAVGVAFLLAGPAILKLLHITVADFMVAGGILLFVISMNDILTGEKSQRKIDPDSLGAVPLGVPLITGPAVLTTSLLLQSQHGFLPTAISLIVNVLIAGIVFHFTESIFRLLGKAGAKTLSKIASLLLAAIAVMIIRRGIVIIVAFGGLPK